VLSEEREIAPATQDCLHFEAPLKFFNHLSLTKNIDGEMQHNNQRVKRQKQN
jgi:hypothetical protein